MLYPYGKEFYSKWFTSDSSFNEIYPPHIRQLSRRHWTPLDIAKRAARFLAVEAGVKILDIGSGVGKFCIGAGYFNPRCEFVGVEQRPDLVGYARNAAEVLELKNVKFIHANFTQLSLRDFDHFYFYNSFYENLADTDKIDDSIDYSSELYHYYNRYLFRQLSVSERGTRLATFHSMEDEIPPDFC